MKISVIGAMRGRVDLTIKSFDSLINQASSLDNFEIVCRWDDDDLDTVNALREYYSDKKNLNIKFLTGERHGYYFLDRYYKDCIDNSDGDYLFLWSNDVVLSTENKTHWDLELQSLDGQFYLADFPMVTNKEQLKRWPFNIAFPRKMIDLLHHKNFPNMMVDIWLFRLFRLNDIWIRFESTCDNHQVWSKGADRDDVYTEGREAWDKGKLSGGKGGKSRGQIARGQLDGWNHFLASDFYSVRDYLKSNPNTKQYETFKFYYCGEDYKYPKEEWTKV